MRLTPKQIDRYNREGFLILPDCFSPTELGIISAQVPGLFGEESARRILETSGEVRSVFAPHHVSPLFNQLGLLSRLVTPATQLLRSDVYIHQYKVNAKVALGGDRWEWHQDFLYWLKEDGMPAARALTAVLFLQDVDEFNGPMLVIPGSHTSTIDVQADPRALPARTNGGATPYLSTLTADLKYKITKKILADLLRANGMRSITGRGGFVLLFHGNLFHASSCNLSPADRLGVFVTYNSVENTLGPVKSPRPEFIASRNFTPIVPVADDALLRYAATPGQAAQRIGELV